MSCDAYNEACKNKSNKVLNLQSDLGLTNCNPIGDFKQMYLGTDEYQIGAPPKKLDG